MAQASGPQQDDYVKAVERLFDDGSVVGFTESQLLERFTADGDDSAFAAIVDRHGPLVLGVCRRFLRDPNDVDDAFQAVFLVLARKADGLRRKDQLANWLYGVACRVACQARTRAARRPAVSDRLDEDARRPRATALVDALARDEERSRLCEEVERLPSRYRTPVVACYFEGKSHEEAAMLLNCPVGTVKGRLSRARDLLRRRLERRGIVVTTTSLATALAASDLRAAVPPPLAAGVTRWASTIAAPPTTWMTSEAVSRSVRSLTEGVLQTMLHAQLKWLAIPGVFAAGLLALGASIASSAQESKAGGNATAKSTSEGQPKAGGGGVGRGGPVPKAEGMSGMMGMGMGGARSSQGFRGPFQIGPGRLKIAAISSALSSIDDRPENQAIVEALRQPYNLVLAEGATLDDVLKLVRNDIKLDGVPIPIFVNTSELSKEWNPKNCPSEIKLEGVPLRTSLRLVLKSIDLAYCIRDGVLIISTVEDVESELEEAQAEMIRLQPRSFELGPDEIIQSTSSQGGFR